MGQGTPVGDVFIADTGNNRVVEVPANGDPQITIGSGFSSPDGVAVDASGDVFVADTGNNRVVEVPANGDPEFTIGSGFGPQTGWLLMLRETCSSPIQGTTGSSRCRRTVIQSSLSAVGSAPRMGWRSTHPGTCSSLTRGTNGSWSYKWGEDRKPR